MAPTGRKVARRRWDLPAASSSPCPAPSEPPSASSPAASCRPRRRPRTSSSLQTGTTPAASYSESAAGEVKRCFSEDWLEMRSVAHLTFLYVFLRGQENHSQRVGKQQKPARVTNDFLFHWPLRDPTVSSSCACVGPRRRWCVNVKLHEQEATGGLPIFTLNQWSRSGTMSEVLFRRCGIGNLNASRAPRPPTQTHRILLQQQETIITDEASGPARKHRRSAMEEVCTSRTGCFI